MLDNKTTKEIKEILAKKIKQETKEITNANSFNEADLKYNNSKINTISLFCGAGGLDLGFELAGLDVIIGKEKTNQILKTKEDFDLGREAGLINHLYANDYFIEAIQTYENNFPSSVLFDCSNIRTIKSFPKADLVLGGFPCPGFSLGGPRLIDDPRNFLYVHFIRCIMDAKPTFFVAENVKGILSLGKGEAFKQIKEDFEAAGYNVYYKLLDAKEYGVGQVRERVILVGVQNEIDYKYQFPKPTHGEGLKPYKTLKETIGDLETDPGEYFIDSYSSIYMSRNRKKKWNEQSFTIQASGRQAPLHPSGMQMQKLSKDTWSFPDGEENHRRLSIKEISRIQGFPDWFQFSHGETKNISTKGRLNKVYKQIGNAVPIELARAVATPIMLWFKDNL